MDDIVIKADIHGINEVFKIDIKPSNIIVFDISLRNNSLHDNEKMMKKVFDFINEKGACPLCIWEGIELNTIDIKDKVLVFKIDGKNYHSAVKQLRKHEQLIKYAAANNCTILTIPTSIEVDTLNETMMNKLGWYRKDDKRRFNKTTK